MYAFLIRAGGAQADGWAGYWFTHGMALLPLGYFYAYSDTVPVGHVISSVPTGGTTQAGVPIVFLTISLGPQYFPVPYLVGLTDAEAQALLALSGLLLGGTPSTAAHEAIPAGRVISQAPLAGTLVDPGSAVTYVLSTGTAVTTMPWTPGLSQADAEDAVVQEGL